MYDKPFFTIIVPTHNSENYISRCIKSIQEQTFIDYELILVDDGSTDKTEEVCKLFFDDSRIKYIKHKKNKGVVAARDAGLIEATGKYIVWVDSDDYIDNDRLYTLYQAITKDNVDIVITGYIQEFQNGRKKKFKDKFKFGVYKSDEYEEMKPHIFEFNKSTGMRNIHTILWNKAIKKELLLISYSKIPPEITIGDDTPRTYIAMLAANSISIIDDYSYHYIENPGQMMKSPPRRDYFQNAIKIYQLIDTINKENKLSSASIDYMISQNISISAIFAILALKNNRNSEERKKLFYEICDNPILHKHLTKALIKKQSLYFQILLWPIIKRNYAFTNVILILYETLIRIIHA